MKTLNTIILVLLIGCAASSSQQDNKAPDRILYRVANAYFRHGEQAALIAQHRSTNRIDEIDDPRIWQVVYNLNGSYIGLDTNSWVWDGKKSTKPDWIILK